MLPVLELYALSPSLASDGSPLRPRIDLNGVWERHVNGSLYDFVNVPSSLRPLGYYHLKRRVELPRLAGRRAFVNVDSVHYHGRVFVNGDEVGTTRPYVPYAFELTRSAREGANSVDVAIADCTPEPGGSGRHEIDLCVHGGWEASGGIVRDAYIELRPSAFIENVALAYALEDGYKRASCRARVFLSAGEGGPARVEVALLHGDVTVAHGARDLTLSPGAQDVEIEFDVAAPLLWSPLTPNLYELKATLQARSETDEWASRTGFRHLKTRGREFVLNGEPLVLAGVCRHDMWKDQGFTLTAAQMDQDMRLIKTMGANFVRLAHYPHHRRIVELADALGLFVTEEPGHWNVRFSEMPRGRIDAGMEILERAIRRDWNSPSIFAWLLGNECNVTLDYLREGRAMCKRIDPIGRFVSFAHIYNDSKHMYDGAELDFYSRHMYDFDTEKFRKAAASFGPDKPLVHTEWGWEDPKGGQITYERSFDRLLDVVDEGLVAGHSFWSWQDVREYTRVDWPTQNGILLSGVVDEAREPRQQLYVELSRLFLRKRHETPPASSRPEPVPLRFKRWSPQSRFQSIELQQIAAAEAARKAWSELETRMEKHWASLDIGDHWKRTGSKLLLWRGSDVDVASVPFAAPVFDGFVRPLVVTPESPEVTIPVGVACVRLHVLGNVTFPGGYPATGKPGEEVGSYSIRTVRGKPRTVPLRNGIEVARANMIYTATRMDPIAAAAPRALTFVKDVVREQYQVLLYSLLVDGDVESITLRLKPGSEPLALFGITAERA